MIFTLSSAHARTACCGLRGRIRVACDGSWGNGGAWSPVCTIVLHLCARAHSKLDCERVSLM